jgi:3-methyl-2-oxobutanoate hydroxymethyltransferase
MDRVTAVELIRMKERGEKIVVLTAYDALFAEIEDQAGVDVILVGDSASMVVAGHETTHPITMDQMLYHCSSVSRGAKRALVIADMPFLSFQVSVEHAIYNAGRFLKEAGVQAVKLEGGIVIADTVKRLVELGIPVMGHLGLTPQSVYRFGGYEVRARDELEALQLRKDAKALEEAGAFSIVLEKIPRKLAAEVSQSLRIPTIGIGSGPGCDGQVLVNYDMLGLYSKFKPRFVRRYLEMAKLVGEAVQQYCKDIRSGNFPSDKESYE